MGWDWDWFGIGMGMGFGIWNGMGWDRIWDFEWVGQNYLDSGRIYNVGQI